ncbi:ATP-dependent DNA helicase UvrD2 [Nocardia sp. CNY236]|uniref:ATP-dependent DNA helicase UvrD2 n=1 Tax=Nocardia sp. CNY236 TaxID=1169152 RepID=UPI0009E03C67
MQRRTVTDCSAGRFAGLVGLPTGGRARVGRRCHDGGVCALDLADLDPEQVAAVRAPRGPVCVLAGAGTGKTRTITHRIAHLISHGHVRPDQVLAVTFTSRSAGELRTRLRSLGLRGAAARVQARTFHAAALRQLRYFWPQVAADMPWRLVDAKLPLVVRAANRVRASTAPDSVRDLLGEIEWAKASLIAPDDYVAALAAHRREPPLDASLVAEVYDGYETLKATPDGLLLDFDDLLLHTAAALENHPAVADEFRGHYRSFVVDEYQDMTPLQQRLLDAWLGDRDDLTVVGDANQTIYSFTGATPRYLLDFSRRFPDATVVRLERNYRSTPQVVSLANQVIGAARGRVAGTRLQLIGQRPEGPEPTFAEYADVPTEATAVAAEIATLIATGTPAAEIAVLYRINAQSESYEQALTEGGIPYQVRGGENFFARVEVQQAVHALRATASRDDLPDRSRRGEAMVSLVRATLASVGFTATEPAGTRARERWSALQALVRLTEEMVGDDDRLDLTGLLRELEVRAAAGHPPTVQGVTLASLHAAKGLEWDAVFLVGLSDGAVPIAHVLHSNGSVADAAALEEERRLLYVGVTRARQTVRLSWALARTAGRPTRRRSRFLHGLVPEASAASRVAAADQRGGARLPSCRVCGRSLLNAGDTLLGRCSSCPAELNAELLAALQDWRREKAAQLSIDARAVASITTLTAIAEQWPTDERALAAIPGIGQYKLRRFGAEMLAIVISFSDSRHKTAGKK